MVATKTRLKQHLFAPKFSLVRHEDIVRRMKQGQQLEKEYFSNGFLQKPVRVIEQTYLGFIHPFTRHCVFLRLPLGIGPGTFLFQTFSQVLRHRLEVLFIINTKVDIDDWLFWHEFAITVRGWLQKPLNFWG